MKESLNTSEVVNHHPVIPWHQVQTIMLDMDGTILDLAYDSHFWLEYMPRAFAAANQIEIEEAKQQLRPIFEHWYGTLNWYCVEFWTNEVGLDIMQLKADLRDNIRYRPASETFLQQCRSHTDNTWLVTNAHRKVLQLKHQQTRVCDYFSVAVCSHELAYPKENPRFWEALQKSHAFDPDSTLFIDDSDPVLKAAAAYGIKHLYSIKSPDSILGRAKDSDFPMIECFSKVLPD